MEKEQSDLWGIIGLLKHIIIGCFVTIVLIVAGFVVYLLFGNSSSTIDTTGVYNLVNSENGEVIATDLTPEDIKYIMEILNGEN